MFFNEKILHTPKAQKAQKSTKTTNATSKQSGYGGPTKQVIVLPSIRTKLGPVKKLNCLSDLIYITTKRRV